MDDIVGWCPLSSGHNEYFLSNARRWPRDSHKGYEDPKLCVGSKSDQSGFVRDPSWQGSHYAGDDRAEGINMVGFSTA